MQRFVVAPQGNVERCKICVFRIKILTSIWLFIKFSCAFCSEISRSLVLVPELIPPCALKGRGAKPSLVFWHCSSWSLWDWLELLASVCGILDVDWGGPDLMVEYNILISVILYIRIEDPPTFYPINIVIIKYSEQFPEKYTSMGNHPFQDDT